MPLTQVPLTEYDIKSLKIKKKSNNNVRIWIFLFSIFTLIFVYVIVGFNASNETLRFIKIVVIIIIAAIILRSLIDTNIDNDFREKIKFIGNVKVKNKIYWLDSEDNRENYILIFDDWRIGEKRVLKDFWNATKEGDEFYIEQAVNSGYILQFKKGNSDVLKEIRLHH